MQIKKVKNDVVILDCCDFDLEKTFECGQCFRWNKQIDGSYTGVVNNKVVHIHKINDEIILKGTSIEDFNDLLENYFDLKTNYSNINKAICDMPFIGDACKYSAGIKILKQDPWEVLISFIISQNNNIPRIKNIINSFCKKFGKKIYGEYFTFPAVEDLKNITLNDLCELKCGFRDKYIIDAIEKIINREVILNDLYFMDVQEARERLMKIKGVGKKVADCTLLYGFSKMNCFPVDVWIKKVITKFFENGLPPIKKEYMGIVQQYIFYYVRSNPDVLN